MHSEPTMERIRRGIVTAMSQWSNDEARIEQETILIQDGHYCGRRFRGPHVQAVWFLEERQIKFYAPDGKLLRVATADEIAHLPDRHVA